MKEIKVVLDKKITVVEKKDGKGVEKEVDNPFSGHVVIDVPTYKERISLVKAMEFKANEKGELVENDSFSKAEFLVGLAEKHLKKIDVKNKEGVKFTSFEDLNYEKDGADLINRIGAMVLEGVKLSPE